MRRSIPISTALTMLDDGDKSHLFTDGGKGEKDIIDHIDGEDEWTDDQRRRYLAAVKRVRRQMPWCLTTFAQIIQNGSERQTSIMNLALRDYRMKSGKRQKSATMTTGSSSCFSSACTGLSASPSTLKG